MRAATRTYYDVLGVSPDTPGVVLKAAYRALAKEYHPDSSAEAASDPERFIELQDAYAVLSDPEARSSYDSELRLVMEESDRQTLVRSPGEAGASSAWAEVIHAKPALQAIHTRFLLYSASLAGSFREAAMTGRSEDDLLAFAEAMEDHFLSQYFGDDQDVRALAKILLLRCRRSAVEELNELLSANTAISPAEKRQLLSAFVERHFAQESLLLPWLREKFAPPRRQAEAAGIAGAGGEEPRPRRSSQHPHAMWTMVRVFCWSCAMYFGLLFVSSLVE